jgi:hypothetical protein
MDSLSTFFSGFDSDTLIAGSILVGSSLLGIAPRVGLGRALTLGWRSAFKTTYPLSVRTNEVNRLRNTFTYLGKGTYTVVIGLKGSGKSCVINTSLNHTFGVVKTNVRKYVLITVCYLLSTFLLSSL